ncbi:MAG: zeta toxin family protein [Flavobacteriales bacterium]|nr:zeta toxin family protein [Flavobacteriales bacterium]MBK9287979.1 zeta toxin family protein [Flavobacteriales bacterium]MBL0037007.1 zeta toxin family protein [Flavobacteriales bacterium]
MAKILRLRVFAGPNGSGKSTMYTQVRETLVNGHPVGMGVYVNPDEIARALKEDGALDFGRYGVVANETELSRFARRSGLLDGDEAILWFQTGQQWSTNVFRLRRQVRADQFAQLIAQFLVDKLIVERKKLSFETVFSHSSKLAVMDKARKNGYKVYLYFVATESPLMNVDRVKTRVKQGGHDVPAEKIVERYWRSLKQLVPALDLCYHAFLFDNSGEEPVMFAEMKVGDGGQQWSWDLQQMPYWFIRFYLLAKGDPQLVDVARKAMRLKG